MAYIWAILHITLLCLASYVVSAGSGHHTNNHEHTESSTMKFGYDPVLHHLIAMTSTKCWITPLTYDERDRVHTTPGLEYLELKMMREWMGVLPEVRIFHDDIHLPDGTKNMCAHKDIFLLQRDVNEMTSPKSPLASVSPSG